MNTTVRRILLLLAALLLAVCFVLPAFAEEEADISQDDLSTLLGDDVEEIAVGQELVSIPLPIDLSGGSVPLENGYLSDTVYEDPTIRVEITFKDISHLQPYKGRNAGLWVVDIQIGDASQFRTAAAESFVTKTAMPAEDIADAVNAVVAFNADFVARQSEGFILKQGVLYEDKDHLKGKQDVLLVDENGDFHPVHLPKKGELSDTVDGKKVLNAFCFGPILVEDGELCTGWKDFGYLKPDELYARLALCQVGPLHYKVLLTTHLQSYTTGIKLQDFAQLCKDEGAITAYNLDGGESTTLYFRGERLNSQHKVNPRPMPDIMYFASSWNGGEDE